MNDTQKIAAIEARKAEDSVVLIELSAVQQDVIAKLGKTNDEVNAIAKSVLASRIKGMLKTYRDGAEAALEQLYDDSSRRGAKYPVDKATFVKAEMSEVNALFNRL